MWDRLITWSQKEFPDLPWRVERSLYRTLVSEIMLQQTTVGTVLQHYERFLQEFPNLSALARASEEELLVAWKGLGYYRRAKSLKKIAETITLQFQDQFPRSLESLQQIKGIGPYTSNALLAIGMDEPALAVDANIERVLARIYALKTPKGPRLQKQIAQLFLEKKIVPERNLSFRALNEALMDLGRTICQARRAACELCPMKRHCLAFKQGEPLAFPKQGQEAVKSKAQDFYLKLLRVVVVQGSQVLAYRKGPGEWLEGQWELPTFMLETNDKNFKQYPEGIGNNDVSELPVVKTGITRYSIQNYIAQMKKSELKRIAGACNYEWRDFSSKQANLSTASLKCLKKIGLLS
jgi:A/G-specific adenine glycosylase